MANGDDGGGREEIIPSSRSVACDPLCLVSKFRNWLGHYLALWLDVSVTSDKGCITILFREFTFGRLCLKKCAFET
jgi:hypothetical protein